MGVSACIITWNEEEMLPGLLAYLDSLRHVNEICILDSNSTDHTQDILNAFRPQGKVFKWETCDFLGFGPHRQKNLDMATQEWILFHDADEVICNIDDLLVRLPEMPHINTVQFGGIMLYPDKKHALWIPNAGIFLNSDWAVPKIVRNGFARFTQDRKCHEILIDNNGRMLYGLYGPETDDKDILRIRDHPEFKNVLIKHASFLRSEAGRLAKGNRWGDTGMVEESARHGIPISRTWFVEVNQIFDRYVASGQYTIKEIPKEYWDVTTEM